MKFPLISPTPIEYHEGFAVKMENRACSTIGLSKMRGLFPHVAARSEHVIACTDTFRSWNGLCLAIVCKHLGKKAVIFYPEYKRGKRVGLVAPIQAYARDKWGAELIATPANRQAQMLYYARTYLSLLDDREMYMLNTGFRFAETSAAVAAEAATLRDKFDVIVVPTGTGTHLRGVVAGKTGARIISHLGYSQDHGRLARFAGADIEIEDESYDYRDKVDIPMPFDANPYYETKTWKWMRQNLKPSRRTLLWNIGGRLPDPSLEKYDEYA